MATPTVVQQVRRHQDSEDRRHCKMKSSTAMFAFLVLMLTALVQADLASQAGDLRANLKASKAAVNELVAGINAKGPEFEKCTTGVAEKVKAFDAAKKSLEACQAKAAAALATPPCLTKDVACLARINAFTIQEQAKAGTCMVNARRSVDPVILRLTADISKCVQETSKNFVPLPTPRFWWSLIGGVLGALTSVIRH